MSDDLSRALTEGDDPMQPRRRGLVIAIDGPSGAGKSTVGRALAERLGYTFLDTGSMYRAVALRAMRDELDLDSERAIADLAERCDIELLECGRRVLLDREDVTAAIRTRAVSAAASRISVHPSVRRNMVARQRRMGEGGGVVADGRDIGTVVFPGAELKVFLDADPAQRAVRRQRELVAAGVDAPLAEVERETRERDLSDSTRDASPLQAAPDSIRVDTTALSPGAVLQLLLGLVASRLGGEE
jgi:cytidylate kinase